MKPYRGKWEEKPLPDPRAGYIGAEEPFATHAGMVSRLDRSVGEVMALLKKLHLEDDTVLVFSSDNGPQASQWLRVADFFKANGPFRGYKGEFYEGGTRVPLVARWPGKIKSGTTNDHICAFWDFLPTFAELAGTTVPNTSDWTSFPSRFVRCSNSATHNLPRSMAEIDLKAVPAPEHDRRPLVCARLAWTPTEATRLSLLGNGTGQKSEPGGSHGKLESNPSQAQWAG